jgi:hypothetical protein
LSRELGFDVPADAFVAMDYHLTWLYASVFLAERGDRPEAPKHLVVQNEAGIVRGNQEDIDLLVAFDQGQKTHLIIIEAKGVTGWTNKQMQSKAKRLGEIFGWGEASERANIWPHFVLTSPRESRQLSHTGWPGWMIPAGRIPWVELKVPDGLLRVSRSDALGKPNALGGYWTLLKGN